MDDVNLIPADQVFNPISDVAGRTYHKYDPILLPLIRRFRPQLIASQIVGVQPMTGNIGKIFALRTKYGNPTDTEEDDIQPDG